MLEDLKTSLKANVNEVLNEAFNEGAVTNDKMTESSKQPQVLKNVFDYVDERIEQTASHMRAEMHESMQEYQKQQKIALLINIGIVFFAIVGVLINKLF